MVSFCLRFQVLKKVLDILPTTPAVKQVKSWSHSSMTFVKNLNRGRLPPSFFERCCRNSTDWLRENPHLSIVCYGETLARRWECCCSCCFAAEKHNEQSNWRDERARDSLSYFNNNWWCALIDSRGEVHISFWSSGRLLECTVPEYFEGWRCCSSQMCFPYCGTRVPHRGDVVRICLFIAKIYRHSWLLYISLFSLWACSFSLFLFHSPPPPSPCALLARRAHARFARWFSRFFCVEK